MGESWEGERGDQGVDVIRREAGRMKGEGKGVLILASKGCKTKLVTLHENKEKVGREVERFFGFLCESGEV